MTIPLRGEVWVVDLGLVAKIRPALVVSICALNTDRDLITIVPHTTSSRGSRFEVQVDASFLKLGVFDAQNLITISRTKFVRCLGHLSGDQLAQVCESIRKWLDLGS